MRLIRPLLAVVLAFVAVPLLAGVKPVVGIPDYNGTYGGTPNTGSVYDVMKGSSVNYTTLYRDNYKRESGCAGERCGSHAGVDINVPSGTAVIASLSGQIVVSKCDSDTKSGYGGLVIIKSPNPYVSGNYVYLVYAHLDDWNDYAVGKNVTQGAVIGKTGGDPNGVCPGASTAKHLHFQVDKNPPNATTGRPWGPKTLFPNEGAEHLDINFDVPKYTHNPIPFVTGWAYNFTFAKDGNTELWGCRNMLCGTSLSQLWMDGSSVYPYAGRSSWIPETTCTWSDGKPCSREITLDASIFKKVTTNLSYACHTNFGYIWYRNEYSDNWYSAKFTHSGSGSYTWDMSPLAEWRGIITDFMIQPGVGCTYYASPYREYFINQVFFTP
ncbi:MAG: M23 family metallopeptidase [Candidatus Pacebacteria bacterium]|nr:M23 family metallopeptidase [Candidatus Paceibacterota bacterium]